jgi:hypothetical protein
MPKTMLLVMILIFAAMMYGWHKIAVLIVGNYGVVGAVIACSVIVAASFIADTSSRM